MKKWICGLACLVFIVGIGIYIGSKSEEPRIEVTVYKSPTCGCCSKWEEHLRKAGFAVISRVTENVDQVKSEKGVPSALQSCHTAVVEGYVVEGHVPAEAIRNLLRNRPKDVKGISVPGMPIGSPGMEGPNPESYEVVTFGDTGEKVIARY